MDLMEYVKTDPRYLEQSDINRAQTDYFNSKEEAVNDCPVCLGRRRVYITPSLTADCDCLSQHENKRLLNASGLTESLRRMTFDNFTTAHNWQKEIFSAAKRYAKDPGNSWFYIGGQVGAGKTHICSAIVAEMSKSGLRARYMVWPNEVDSIKGNAEGFNEALEQWMEVKVLCIDDFLKTTTEQRRGQNGRVETAKRAPTAGELNAGFKLINHRYNRGDLLTIFSSEFFLDDIIRFDAGLGSRIYQRCSKFLFEIGNDDGKNMRLTNEVSGHDPNP